MSNGLHRSPLTHNPRVVSLEELNRIRYGAGGTRVAAPSEALTPTENGLPPPMNAVQDEPPPALSPPGRRKKRNTFTPEQRLQILAELSQPGAKPADVYKKYDVHQVTVWAWKKKLEDQPRKRKGFKPAKRRRVAKLFSDNAPPPRNRADGGRFANIAEVRAALARLIEDAQIAAKGVEALQMELDRMRSIFGGE